MQLRRRRWRVVCETCGVHLVVISGRSALRSSWRDGGDVLDLVDMLGHVHSCDADVAAVR